MEKSRKVFHLDWREFSNQFSSDELQHLITYMPFKEKHNYVLILKWLVPTDSNLTKQKSAMELKACFGKVPVEHKHSLERQHWQYLLKSEDHFFNSDASPYTQTINVHGFEHLSCALHPTGSMALACSDELGKESVSTLGSNFSTAAVLSVCPLQMQVQVSGVPCKLWRSQSCSASPVVLAPTGAACRGAGLMELQQSTQLLLSALVGLPNLSPVIKEQIFQRKIWFHQFHTHFKAAFNHFCTSPYFLPLLSRSCFHEAQ